MVSPTPVSKVTNFQFHGLIQLLASLVGSLLLNLLLHGLRIEHLFVEIETHFPCEWIHTTIIRLLGPLTFLEFFPVKHEFFNGLLPLCHIFYVVLVSVWDLDATFLVKHLSFN